MADAITFAPSRPTLAAAVYPEMVTEIAQTAQELTSAEQVYATQIVKVMAEMVSVLFPPQGKKPQDVLDTLSQDSQAIIKDVLKKCNLLDILKQEVGPVDSAGQAVLRAAIGTGSGQISQAQALNIWQTLFIKSDNLYKTVEQQVMRLAICEDIDRPTLAKKIYPEMITALPASGLSAAEQAVAKVLLEAMIAKVNALFPAPGPNQPLGPVDLAGQAILQRAVPGQLSAEQAQKIWSILFQRTSGNGNLYAQSEHVVMQRLITNKPTITGIAPDRLALRPGQAQTITINGKNFPDKNNILIDFILDTVVTDKITLTALEVSVDGNTITLQIAVAEGAQAGSYGIKIYSKLCNNIFDLRLNAFNVVAPAPTGLSTVEVFDRLRVQDSYFEINYPIPLIRHRQPDDAATLPEYGTFVDPNGYRGEFSIAPTIIGNRGLDDRYSPYSIHNLFFGPQLDNAFIENDWIGITPSAFGAFNGPIVDSPENGGADYSLGGGLNLRGLPGWGLPGWHYLMPDLRYNLTYASIGNYQTIQTASEAFPRSTSLAHEAGFSLTSELMRDGLVPLTLSAGTVFTKKTTNYAEETFGRRTTGEDTALNFYGRAGAFLSTGIGPAFPDLGLEFGLIPWMPMSRHQTIDYLSVSGDTQVDTVSEDQVYNRHAGIDLYWSKLSSPLYLAFYYDNSYTEGELPIDTYTAYFGVDFKRFVSLAGQYSWATGISPYIEGGQQRFELILTGPTGRANGWLSALYAGFGYEQNQDSHELYYPNFILTAGVRPFRFFGVPGDHR